MLTPFSKKKRGMDPKDKKNKKEEEEKEETKTLDPNTEKEVIRLLDHLVDNKPFKELLTRKYINFFDETLINNLQKIEKFTKNQEQEKSEKIFVDIVMHADNYLDERNEDFKLKKKNCPQSTKIFANLVYYINDKFGLYDMCKPDPVTANTEEIEIPGSWGFGKTVQKVSVYKKVIFVFVRNDLVTPVITGNHQGANLDVSSDY